VEELHRLRRIGRSVDRLEFRLVPSPPLLVEKLQIPFLYPGAVGKHQGTEVAGGGSGMDRSGEAPSDEGGDGPGMVDMGVRQYDGVDGRGIEPRIPVQGVTLAPVALMKAAIEKNPPAVELHEMHGTRYGTGGTVKRYPQWRPPWIERRLSLQAQPGATPRDACPHEEVRAGCRNGDALFRGHRRPSEIDSYRPFTEPS